MVPPSPHSWADRHRPAVVLFAAGATTVGMASAVRVYGFDHPGRWIPDLLVGSAFLGLGAVRLRIPSAGALMMLTGLAWWLGTLVPSLTYLHRGVLVYVLASFPGWRTGSRRWTVGLLAVAAFLSIYPVGNSDYGTIAFGVTAAAASVSRTTRSDGLDPRARAASVWASIVIMAGTVGLGLYRIAGDGSPASADLSLAVYASTLVVAALILGWALRRPRSAMLADLVVELDEAGSQTLRDSLRKTLGDPLLEIGFRNEAGVFVSTAGWPITLPDPGAERVATVFSREGGGDALLVHHVSFLQDPGFVDAVASVTRLSKANAELNSEVRAQAAALEVSRRRLFTAEDDERRLLAARTRRGPAAALSEVDAMLESTIEKTRDQPTTLATLKALEQLRLARQDLVAIADGLHPAALEDSLEAAIGSLVEALDVRTSVSITTPPLAPAIRAAVYYVCAEAVANVVKHAAARCLELSVQTADGVVRMVVVDDGVGGAGITGGTGLRGLVERVNHLGGAVRISSPLGGGTRLVAEIPLDDESSIHAD